MSEQTLFTGTPLQPVAFLWCLAAGGGTGVLFCMLQALRSRFPRFLRPLADAVLGCCAAGLCVLALALGGEERLRWYALLGMTLGFVLSAGAVLGIWHFLSPRQKNGSRQAGTSFHAPKRKEDKLP